MVGEAARSRRARGCRPGDDVLTRSAPRSRNLDQGSLNNTMGSKLHVDEPMAQARCLAFIVARPKSAPAAMAVPKSEVLGCCFSIGLSAQRRPLLYLKPLKDTVPRPPAVAGSKAMAPG